VRKKKAYKTINFNNDSFKEMRDALRHLGGKSPSIASSEKCQKNIYHANVDDVI